MAKWILCNTIRFDSPGVGPTVLSAGRTIDDAQQSLAAIQAAGGIVAPPTYPTVAANAAIATALLKKGGAGGIGWTGEADAMMLASFMADQLAMEQNRASSNNAAGQTVAAAAAIAPNVVITPKYSGKVRIRAWVSFAALGAGVVTPILKQGNTTIAAPAISAGTGGPLSYYVEQEVTGLALGTSVTFSFVTTAGDAVVTVGHGATGNGAYMVAEEVA